MSNKTIRELMKEHKTALIVIAVILFLIELEIFAIAALKSGRKEYLQIFDANGNLVHEADGGNLSEFNKYYFEKTFGDLDNYEKVLRTEYVPFPFRAWFTAAVGIPIGIILLFAFVVRAYINIFHDDSKRDSSRNNGDRASPDTSLEKILETVSGLNIFTIGFLVLIMVLMYWIIPNAVSYLSQVGVETLVRFKWVFIAVGAVLVGLFVWVIYLRYLLARRTIDKQAELQRARLELEFRHQVNLSNPRLEYNPDNPKQLVTWEETTSADEDSTADGAAENG